MLSDLISPGAGRYVEGSAMTGSLEQAPAPAGARRARPRTGRLPVMTDTTRTGLPPAAPLRPEGLRLIAVDMDGTFLGAGMPGTYDRARFAPLRRRMRERGVRFVVASGNQEQINSVKIFIKFTIVRLTL